MPNVAPRTPDSCLMCVNPRSLSSNVPFRCPQHPEIALRRLTLWSNPTYHELRLLPGIAALKFRQKRCPDGSVSQL